MHLSLHIRYFAGQVHKFHFNSKDNLKFSSFTILNSGLMIKIPPEVLIFRFSIFHGKSLTSGQSMFSSQFLKRPQGKKVSQSHDSSISGGKISNPLRCCSSQLRQKLAPRSFKSFGTEKYFLFSNLPQISRKEN